MRSTRTKNRKQKLTKRRIILIALLAFFIIISNVFLNQYRDSKVMANMEKTDTPNWIEEDFLDVDGASRSETKLDELNGIVIHYVANPGSSAKNNRDYFNKPETTVSSHFVVGLDGEIIQCLPLYERSVASNDRNHDTISIEVCHPDKSGKFSYKTMKSLIKLTAWLKDIGRLDKDEIIRHYDVTGKLCPKYYVEHEDAWKDFKTEVMRY